MFFFARSKHIHRYTNVCVFVLQFNRSPQELPEQENLHVRSAYYDSALLAQNIFYSIKTYFAQISDNLNYILIYDVEVASRERLENGDLEYFGDEQGL